METSELLLLLADLALSFSWVCFGSLPRILLLHGFFRKGILREIVDGLWYIFSSSVFSWLGFVARGGAFNPLNVLCAAMDGATSMFPSMVAGRILAQVAGSTIGAGLVTVLFSHLRYESCGNMDVHQGALLEGFMSFLYVVFKLGTRKRYPANLVFTESIMNAWKLILRLLSGGCMNPASAFGWAFSRGEHATREHLFVYWLAPFEATLLGFWVSSLLVEEATFHDEEGKRKKKLN